MMELNNYQLSEIITDDIDIFSYGNKKAHSLEIGDLIVQSIDNAHILNMYVVGEEIPKIPRNHLVVRFRLVMSDANRFEAMQDLRDKLKAWVRPRFNVYYHGTCQQFITIRNLRIAIAEMLFSNNR